VIPGLKNGGIASPVLVTNNQQAAEV